MGVVEPEPLGTDSSVSTSPLSLVLTATQLGRNAYGGIAFIGVNAQSPQTYSAGAILANGARIKEIHRDYVVLERAGQTVRLYVSDRQPANYRSPHSSLLTVGGLPSPEPAQANSRDPLTNVMRVSPTFAGHSFAGVTVFASQQSDAFSRLGLQNGDVITAIDGAPLSDQRKALEALRPLLMGAALTATVRRGNQIQTISLDGAVLL